MPEFDDIVQSLKRLRDVIELESPFFTGPAITGIEVTQAIQYYDSSEHLSDPADRGMDNAATLVAYKPAIVRVYVRPPLGDTLGEPVTGELLVERGKFFGPYRTIGTYAPVWTNTVTPQDDSYDDERRNWWRSLNFRIPASDFVGSLRLTVTLETGQTHTVSVVAALVQTLRVRVIGVHYQGPSTSSPPAGTAATALDLPAPSLADAQVTAALAFRAMPVQQTGSFATAGAMNWFVPLDDPRNGAGGCSDNWNSLLAWMRLIRDNDGNRSDVVYYGLLPAGMPVGVPGCGEGGLGAGRVGDTVTFVHEIGHGYGFAHTPSGSVGTPDPDYPVYEPHPSASIGEYGIDIQNGQVYSPASSTDYMSYGPMRWMSLYQHNRLISHPRLAPTWIRDKNPFEDVPIPYDPDDLWWPDPPWRREELVIHELRPMISVRGFVDERGAVRVDSVARVTASATMHGPATDWSLQLVSGRGEVASRGQLTRVDNHGGQACGCAPGAHEGNPNRLPFAFHAMIPDAEPGAALQITDPRGEGSWERLAPERPARFTRAEGALDGDSLRLSWSLDRGIEVADVWAQWSQDDGRSWHGLAIGLTDGDELSVAGLPAGVVLVRLLGHDGFSTAYSDAIEVEIPQRAPEVAILYPTDTGTVLADTPIEVFGSAVDQAGAPIEEERLEWLVDGEPVGRGRVVSLTLEPGEHTVSLVAHAAPEGSTRVRVQALRLEDAAGTQ
ncbi:MULTISPECIES: M66 family metalloprotease [unclassified Microbacterium]|uniref:M66 family metalloprotease n=1 Tax=unclassified Microbacterium TaxID=2609290 RepID=UPI00214A9601|nr:MULTISPECIES: M66 family metalloprotease [unclassified Microbacterium]MCR2809202.1 M66 family metalloprotease [Microbacterium sp. zg.B185]WIM20349.1 M66 family metalloprotease [Microbacterium sp. zg-B185]